MREPGHEWKVPSGSRLQSPSQNHSLWTRGQPSLASAWLSGPACPKAQEEGCCGTELKEKKLFGQCIQSTVLEKVPGRKGLPAGPGHSHRQALCREPGILSQSQEGAREGSGFAFQIDDRVSVGSLLGNAKVPLTQTQKQKQIGKKQKL